MPRWWAAPAKINLYLHVTGRRADGYHLLDSLVAFADIGDRLSVAPADAYRLALSGPFAPALDGTDADNLVTRAARGLAAKLGHDAAVAIALEKNLPVASGIGGGSSDAAATLKALIDLWQAALDHGTAMALAAELGADVPVCFIGRPCFFGNIGDEIAEAPALPRTPIVLANPGIALPTATVFRARQGGFSAPARFARPPADIAEFAALLATRRNDLTDAALSLVPEIGTVIARLGAEPGALLARMSGSGATCFALFETEGAAEAAAATLRSEQPRWWVAAGMLG